VIAIQSYLHTICYLFIIYSPNRTHIDLLLIAFIWPVYLQNKHPVMDKAGWHREMVSNHSI